MRRTVIEIAQHNDTDAMLCAHELYKDRSGYRERCRDLESAEQARQRSRKAQLPIYSPRFRSKRVHQLHCREIDTAQPAEHIQSDWEKSNVPRNDNPRHLLIPYNAVDNRSQPQNRNHLGGYRIRKGELFNRLRQAHQHCQEHSGRCTDQKSDAGIAEGRPALLEQRTAVFP
ncbi:hypothetical protein D3C73_848590 [compost metagenome]